MGGGNSVCAQRLFGVSRPIVAGLAFCFTLLLTAQAGHAQPAPPAPGSSGSTLNPYATSSGYAKRISAARSEKCRTKSVQDLIKLLKDGLPTLEWQIVEAKRSAETWQEILTSKESEGATADAIDALKNVIRKYYNMISDLTNEVNQQRSDIKSLEGKPPCPEPKAAAQPPPGPTGPPSTPGGFGALPICGDVSAEIKGLTEEIAKLNKEEPSLQAALAKDISNNEAAQRDQSMGSLQRASFQARVDADRKQIDANHAKINSDRKRIAALYGVPPCPETPQAAAPPPAGQNLPCRTKDDDSEYVRLDAELERLSQEHDKLFPAATNPAGKAALSENNKKIEDVIRKKDAIRAREPCPPQPAAGEVPPENEHGMAPNQPNGPGLPFGFGFGGGGGFGFGGSDEGQSDRGFGKNQNRKP
jgi:ribosomal protein L29